MRRPAIVLLHSFGGSARSWDEVIERLGNEWDTLAIDLPGFGDAAEAPGPYTMDGYADHVAALLEGSRIGKHLLIGHSMGGKIALALAARRSPDLVGLVLLAPSPPTPEPMAEAERRRMLAGWGDRSESNALVGRITAAPLPPSIRASAVQDQLRVGRAAWEAWLLHGSREDISARMAAVDAPAIVLSGSEDEVLPPKVQQREVVDRLPEARLLRVAGAGHLLPLEVPGAVADAIGTACHAFTGLREANAGHRLPRSPDAEVNRL